jgi:SAM-dependent methyltransferase
VVDHQFADAGLAALYDVLHPWEQRDDLEFYLPLVMAADAALDVGCGTGSLLHRARDNGYRGRLCGLDPGAGMLERARTRSDIEWVDDSINAAAFDREFDLVVMTGHAFQVLTGDDDLRASLSAIRSALVDAGRFAFETRNPSFRAWETWTPDRAVEMATSDGTRVRMQHQVTAVADDLVSFETTYASPSWPRPQVSSSTLRFLDADAVDRFLVGAGLRVVEQFGDWDRSPLTEASPEIITIATRA